MNRIDNIDSAEAKPVPIEEIAPEVFRRGGSISFIATGASMWPHIRHGDTVAGEPLAPGEQLRTGQVIVYLTPRGRLSVHRVIGNISGSVLKVRGDSSVGPAEQVPRDSVLGKVVFIKRRQRKIDLNSPVRKLQGRFIGFTAPLRIPTERLLRRFYWKVTGRGGY